MAVIVYTTPTCGFCGKVKDYLKERGIKFTEYNVAENRQ
jgi:glutaredoxin 3